VSNSDASHRTSITVTEQKLAAAARLYDGLEGWRTMVEVLDDLRYAYPSNQDLKAVLLKASVLNQLYFTNVLAIHDMAKHICEVFRSPQAPTGPSLVQRIAEVEFGGKPRRFVSFASKYAHFFVDPSQYAIVDSYAGWALAVHLGEPKTRSEEWNREYAVFSRKIDWLRTRDGITVSLRHLDQYLWLYGCWMDYQQDRSKSNQRERLRNKEVKALFDQQSPDLQLAFGG
jgi:hypothetical protein